MTETPPGRPSEPRTDPAAPAPAHGDGPTRPSAPTGRTGPRGCPFGFRHYNCDCKPLEATTPEPADRPPCLRDRIAAAVLGFHGRTGADASDRALAYGTADAVLPVVEAETARVEADTLTALTAARDQRHRAEKAERERDTAREALDAAAIVIASLRDQRDDASKRAEEAEARLRRYDTAIADERRDKLTAEAAVRRAQALADRWSAALGVDIAHARALREALTIEQPEETP